MSSSCAMFCSRGCGRCQISNGQSCVTFLPRVTCTAKAFSRALQSMHMITEDMFTGWFADGGHADMYSRAHCCNCCSCCWPLFCFLEAVSPVWSSSNNGLITGSQPTGTSEVCNEQINGSLSQLQLAHVHQQWCSAGSLSFRSCSLSHKMGVSLIKSLIRCF